MNNIRTLCKAALSLSLLAAAGGFAPSAFSASFDAKSYPGATCNAWNGSQESGLTHTNQGTLNTSSVSLMVTCPIVRDNIANKNGTYIAPTGAGGFGVQVYVDNQSAPNALICKLYSNDQWGAAVSATSAASPVGLNALSLNVSISVVGTGYYVLACTLPPKSSIRSYQVFEYLNTDSDS